METKSSNQLQWVILLLAAAVILPTVCLLWFMTQAVKNERLAVRQKLIDVYTAKADLFISRLDEKQSQLEQQIEQVEQQSTFSFFTDFCCDKQYADGLLIYDGNDQMVFPVPAKSRFSQTDRFEEAWRSEFVDADYLRAAKQYEQAIAFSSIPHEVFDGQRAMVRCYEKAGQIEEAIDICMELAYPGKYIANEFSPSDIMRARLKLLQLYRKNDRESFEKQAAGFLSDLIREQKRGPDSVTRAMVLDELLKLMNVTEFAQHAGEIFKAQKLLEAESLSLSAVERFSNVSDPLQWPEKTLNTLELDESVYAMLFKTDSKKVILLIRRSHLIEAMTDFAERLSDPTAVVGVFDERDGLIFGENENIHDAFVTVQPSYFIKWRWAFFFRNQGIFDNAASRQEAVYLWTGMLVVVLILGFGFIAIQAIGREIRLNRLKNNFIATVTHELKTPLASIRVLVDTLIDKNYDDDKTPDQYLRLISRENERLSRLIDNFLTFSRMERNKQAFEIVKTDPAEIARAAAEVVQAKFNQKNCNFSVNIADDLHSIMADKDAMVTVLVNLLDNACKYSNEDKEIGLKVYLENNRVCFKVTDNGIGMPPRVAKRIFDKFYQADTSLARKTQGCGLGLSIVKFIVDAHNGTIEVDSKPGKGSEFIVKIPV